MTVSLVATFQASPENLQAIAALGPEAKSVATRLGAVGYRSFRVRIAGPNTGGLITVVEFPSNEALGRYLDSVGGDPEGAAVLGEAFALADDVSTSVLDEVPTD